jgi:hypothetical protein
LPDKIVSRGTLDFIFEGVRRLHVAPLVAPGVGFGLLVHDTAFAYAHNKQLIREKGTTLQWALGAVRVKATNKTKPGAEQGPNVEEVHREDWDKFGLGPSRVARVEHNSPTAGLTTFYVNWDYPLLDEKLMAERKASIDEIDPYKRKFCAAMAYSAWMQDSGVDNGEAASLTQEERDAELRRAARMFLFSEFLKDREV